MLTEIYIEALLVDEELADQVWDAGEIDDSIATFVWWSIVIDWGQRKWDRSSGKDDQESRRVRAQGNRSLQRYDPVLRQRSGAHATWETAGYSAGFS